MIDRYALKRDDVAVVGMACRFPGAPTPDAFWRIVRDGIATVADPPAGRRTGDEAASSGGFLDSVDQFDAGFFGISPREAAQMDPQQRLMLELAWEGLEDAGFTSNRLAGSRTGVFVGAMRDDYAVLVHRRGTASVGQHTLAGLNLGDDGESRVQFSRPERTESGDRYRTVVIVGCRSPCPAKLAQRGVRRGARRWRQPDPDRAQYG